MSCRGGFGLFIYMRGVGDADLRLWHGRRTTATVDHEGYVETEGPILDTDQAREAAQVATALCSLMHRKLLHTS